jgi:hypothetical protein
MSYDPYAILQQLSGGIYTGAAPPPMVQQRTANADRRATARAQRTSPSAHAPPARGSAQARPVFVTGATLVLPHSSVARAPTLSASIAKKVIAASAPILAKPAPPRQVGVPPLPAPMPRSVAPSAAAANQFLVPISAPAPTLAPSLANSPALRAIVTANLASTVGPPQQVGPGAALSSAAASQARAIANRAMNGPGPLGQPSGLSSVSSSPSLPVSQAAALASAAFANGMVLAPPAAQPTPTSFTAPPRPTSPNSFVAAPLAASLSSFAAPSRGAGPQPKPARGSAMRYQPTGKRTYCPFVSLAVAASATVDIIVRPQLVFRADEIIVGNTVAAYPFNLVQVKIGVVPQAVAGGEVPTECFPAQNGPKFGFDIADQGTDITMTVKNYNAAAKDFYGILVGDEVYPVAA